jgi:ubiquinone/menaquinone biosynthesis C-methylase UbiE
VTTNTAPPQRSDKTKDIRKYWNRNPLGTQFRLDDDLEVGSDAFFEHIRPRMTERFPWIVELIDSRGPKLAGKRLLEIGCGMGFDTLAWAKHGLDITAIDLSNESVGLARKNLGRKQLEADFTNASALSLPFADESFDVVHSRGVLHHTGDTPRAIEEVRRVLRPGGSAFICHIYRRYSWMYFISRYGREPIEFKEGDPPVTDFFTVPEVNAMFKGFSSHEVHLHHYRALKTIRTGTKASLYNNVFVPVYNTLPEGLAKRLAYKISVYATK